MSVKTSAAILACRAVRSAARLLHRGGTAKPGEIALKIDPKLLKTVSAGVETIVVTGTNGKTTSCRMLEAAFAAAGLPCAANRSGANLMSGITAEFAMSSSLSGVCAKKYAVMECDEGWTRKVLPEMRPKVFLVTNLFKDQVDRYGNVTNTLAAIRAGIAGSPETVLCLNADDPVTASLAEGVPNPVVWYGLNAAAGTAGIRPGENELVSCVCCGAALDYDYVTYAHLGGFRCPSCGRKRHEADVAVEAVETLGRTNSTVLLRACGETRRVTVNQPALYNVSNAAGAVAAATAAGLSLDCAVSAVESFEAGFGRMETFDVGAKGSRMMLVKNAAGCDQVLRFLADETEDFCLIFVTNNRSADGTDMSWLEDAGFETLSSMPHLKHIMLSGICAEMLYARLQRAGVPDTLLTLEPDYDRLAAAAADSDLPVFILPSYTGMMEFRPYLIKRTGGADFWE